MDIKDLAKAIEDRDTETIKKLAAIEDETKTLGRRVDEEFAQIEQRLAEGGGGWGEPSGNAKSLGNTFIGDPSVIEGMKTLAGTGRGAVSMAVKATITSATTNAAGSAGAGIAPQREGIQPLVQQSLSIRDIVPVVQMNSSSVEVPVQKGRTNNAGMVAEGAAKPESDLQLELKTFNARVIAHHMKASRQILDDIPQLRGLIDSELVYGLKVKEDSQLLNGDGTGQNLFGMVPQATAFAPPITLASPQNIDIIGLALLQVANAEYQPDAVVVHPSEWFKIRTLKDAGGNYIYGDPGEVVVPRIFGAPIVPSLGMAADKFLVGNFQQAATIYDRWDARVELGYVNDDFTKNMVTLLGEERLAFAVKRPGALVYGDFSDAVTAATAS